MRINNEAGRTAQPERPFMQKQTGRKDKNEGDLAGEGFLPVKSHPIGDEIRHYRVDNSGEIPERVHFDVRDAREPLPFERVRQLLTDIKQSLLNDDEALKAQRASPPETVLKLID